MKATKYALAVILGLVALVTPRAGSAETTTYTYTGNPFNVFVGVSCPPYCSIDGSFSINGSLTPSSTSSITPTLFDFFTLPSDTPSWTNTNGATIQSFLVTTDAADNIVGWAIELLSNPEFPFLKSCNGVSDCNSIAEGQPGDGVGTGVQNGAIQGAVIFDSPGQWSPPMTTPEPTSLLLLGTGLVGMLGAVRRKLIS